MPYLTHKVPLVTTAHGSTKVIRGASLAATDTNAGWPLTD